MNFKKQRLNKALEDKIYRVKLVHSKKGWLTVGLTFITLLGFTALGGKTVDASTTNNVAIAKAAKGNYVQLWSDVTSNGIHKTNRALGNGTAWKTAASVTGVDGETYLLVGGNEYANVKDMALQNETSSQGLLGVVHTRTDKKITRLYGDPTQGAKLITNRALGRDTYWKTDKKVVVNGETYYRVATNEWVKAEDAYLTGNSNNGSTETNQNNNNSGSTTGNTNHNNGGTTTPTTQKATIIVHHVKADGTKFGDDETFTREVGSTFDAQSRDTTGWMPEKMTQTITVHKGTNEVTFVYHQTKEGNIKVNYVDEKGNSIADADNQSGYYGANVPVNAKDIDGYTLIGAKSQTVKVSENGNTVTFKYKKNDTTAVTPTAEKANVTINAVDESGNPIPNFEVNTISDQTVGQSNEYSAPVVPGYTLVGNAKQSIVVAKDGSTVTFTYKKNDTTPVTPTVEKADITGNAIPNFKAYSIKDQEVGKDYKASAPVISGYTVVGTSEQTINVAKGGSVARFVYKKNDVPVTPTVDKANLTVNYVDESGTTIAKSNVLSREVGKTAYVTAMDIPGFTLKGNSTQGINVGKDGSVITFTYSKNSVVKPSDDSTTIHVKYVDETGKEIHPEGEQSGTIDYTSRIDAIDIPNYKLKDGEKAYQIYTAVKGDNTVTFVYTPVAADKMATVTVNYVDNKGIKLANSKVTKVEKGTTFSDVAKDIKNYNVDALNKSLGVITKDATLNFVYTAPEKGKYQYKISYLGFSGNYLGGGTEEDYTYPLHAPVYGYANKTGNMNLSKEVLKFDGYEIYDNPIESGNYFISDTVNGSKEGNNIQIYYVAKEQPITIHYVDKDGNKLAPDATDSWYTDDSYQAKAPKVSGYYLANSQGKITVKPGQNDITITYTKNPVIDTNEVANKFIDLVNEYRKQKGLTPFAKNSLLVAGSQARANDELSQMKKSGNPGDFDHDMSNGKSFSSEPHLFEYSEHGLNAVGENISSAYGFMTPEEIAKDAFENLKADEPHRLQMVNKHLYETGVGVARFSDDTWVLVQNFGGKIPNDVWNASDFNTTTPETLNYTQQEIGNLTMIEYNDELHSGTENYYVGDHIFKSDSDFYAWKASFANNSKANDSIWTKGGSQADLSSAKLINVNGQTIGYVPYMSNMDKPAKDYLNGGATKWF